MIHLEKKEENLFQVKSELTGMEMIVDENGKVISGTGFSCYVDENTLTFANGKDAMVKINKKTGIVKRSRGKFKEYCFNE